MLSTIQWTVEDYQQIVKTGILDDRPVQLLAGDIVTMAPEAEPHAFFIGTGLGDRATSRTGIYISLHPYPENIFWLIEDSGSAALPASLSNDESHYCGWGLRLA